MNTYQSGTLEEYELLCTFSEDPDKFEIIFEFTSTPNQVIDEMVYVLNSMRGNNQKPISTFDFYSN